MKCNCIMEYCEKCNPNKDELPKSSFKKSFPPEPASNEEIELRLKKRFDKVCAALECEPKGYQRMEFFEWFKEGAKALSSELKAQKPGCEKCGYNGPGYYQPDTHPCMAKPVDQCDLTHELNLQTGKCFCGIYRAHELKSLTPRVEDFKAGASYQAGVSEAIGEAKGIKWAIEYFSDHNYVASSSMEEEARRQGKL